MEDELLEIVEDEEVGGVGEEMEDELVALLLDLGIYVGVVDVVGGDSDEPEGESEEGVADFYGHLGMRVRLSLFENGNDIGYLVLERMGERLRTCLLWLYLGVEELGDVGEEQGDGVHHVRQNHSLLFIIHNDETLQQ